MPIHPTALVASGAAIGQGTSVGPFSIVHANVELGARSRVDAYCILGHTEPGTEPKQLTLGEDAQIRSHSVIYGGSEIGCGLETGHRVTIREGALIGDDFRVGTQSDIQGHCRIGRHVRLHSNVFLAQRSSVGNFVWIFPHVVVTDDPHPPSDGFHAGATIEDYAAISARSVILPGVKIGRDSLVGAASLVTRDVRPGSVVLGVPAEDRGDASAIALQDGSGPAYPWRRHFHRGYPQDVVDAWKAEFES